jgi:hypothetical protein
VTPTQRSLKHLRDNGYRAAVVEKFNHVTNRRADLFEIGDILAIRDNETVLVQTTSGSNVSARVKKIATCDAISDIRSAGWRVIVHGWRKSSRNRWVLREVDCS